MTVRTAVQWFRTDLRVADNPVLLDLLDTAEPCDRFVGVYCFDPREFAQLDWGFARTGARRASYLIESVAALRDELRARGGELAVRIGRPRDCVPELVRAVNATVLGFADEAADWERREQAAVAAAIAPDVALRTVWGHTLVPLERLPFELDELPGVFTQFRKQVERKVSVPPAHPAPRALPPPPDPLESGDIPTLGDLGLEPVARDSRALNKFVGGERAGLERLDQYIWQRDRLRVYKETRNGMLAPDDSSKLSPWLATGALSPRQVLDEIDRYERERVRNDSTYWLLFELWWRDFFRFVALAAGASLFRRTGLRGKDKPWRWDESGFRAWCAGRTGYPLVDANMQELAATGYMSNRGRQIVASFFVNDLRLDWRAGAAWFESQLLDYDPCSNWGNWAYQAGVGNDPRPSRYFALDKQARNYDPDAHYVRHWLPTLAELPAAVAHAPWRATGDVNYPSRIVDLRPAPRQ